MKYLLLSFVVICNYLLVTVNTAAAGIGSCPQLQPKKPIDVSKLFGTWYLQEAVPTKGRLPLFSTDPAASCLEFTIGSTGNPHVMNITASKVMADNIIEDQGTIALHDFNYQGNMFVFWGTGLYPISVMATDYTNWMILYYCANVHDIEIRKSAAILSRKRDLDVTVLITLRSVLESYEFEAKQLVVSSQENCDIQGPPSAVSTTVKPVVVNTPAVSVGPPVNIPVTRARRRNLQHDTKKEVPSYFYDE